MSTTSHDFVAELERLMEAFQHQQRCEFRDRRLTPLKYLILKWLSKDADATLTRLAGLLEVRPQTVTPIVDGLERSGWLRRTRSRTDRRKSILVVTPRGIRLLEEVRATYFERVRRALDGTPAASLRVSADMLARATAALAGNGKDDPRRPTADRPSSRADRVR